MLASLKIGDDHAKAIIERAIELDAYSDPMPSSKKDRLEAAHELVSFAIDAWVNENVRPDAKDKETREAGEQVAEILELAGVEIDPEDSGIIHYNEPPEFEDEDEDEEDDEDEDDEDEEEDDEDEDEDEEDDEEDEEDEDDESESYEDWEISDLQEEVKSRGLSAGRGRPSKTKLIALLEEHDESSDDDDDEEDDDEAAFDIDDIIDGYDELSIKSIITKLKKLDEDEVKQVREYEQVNEERGRILDAINEILGEEEGDDDEEEEDDSNSEEPWEGYDTAKLSEIKDALTEAAEADEDALTAEQANYVIEYEEANKNRSGIIKHLKSLISDMENGDDDEADDEEEEAPAPKKGRAKKSSKKAKSTGERDYSDEEVQAMVPSGLAHAFVSSVLHEEALRKAGLEPPSDFEGDMPQLPEDIASVDHSELSNLMLEFQNALATATWQASMAYIEADISEEIAEYLENRGLLESDESTETKRKAEAKTDERVVFFRGRRANSYHNYVRFRDVARTIEGKIKVISRVGGFVGDEHEASDRTPSKRSTRGSSKGSTVKRRSRS
jgi:hypothetical protein